MLRRFTDFILQGRPQAIGVAFVCAFIPLISSVSGLLAAFITLRKGVFEGALVTCAIMFASLLTYIGAPTESRTTLAFYAILVILMTNLLIWLFAVLLRKYQNWGLVLDVAGWFGIAAVLIVHLSYPDVQAWWTQQLQMYFAKTKSLMGVLNKEEEVAWSATQLQAISYIKGYATGLIAVSILFNALLQVVLARWWQAIIYNPGGLRKELYQLRLSVLTAIVFIIGAVLALLGNTWATDILPVFCAMFVASGLCFIHYKLSFTKYSWLGLAIVYLTIIWFFPISAILVAVVGLLDTLLYSRKQIPNIN